MRRLAYASLMLFALALPGCAQKCSCVSGGSAAGNPAAPQPTETRADRGKVSADLNAVTSYQAVDRVLTAAPTPAQYRVLRAEEVQCLAAANAPLANMYASESDARVGQIQPPNAMQRAGCQQADGLSRRRRTEQGRRHCT